MGYDTRNHGQIRTYWPDDDENTLHVGYAVPLSDILKKSKEKWGEDINFDNLHISASHIHTDCLGYDRYDSGDYTDFIIVTRVLQNGNDKT